MAVEEADIADQLAVALAFDRPESEAVERPDADRRQPGAASILRRIGWPPKC